MKKLMIGMAVAVLCAMGAENARAVVAGFALDQVPGDGGKRETTSRLIDSRTGSWRTAAVMHVSVLTSTLISTAITGAEISYVLPTGTVGYQIQIKPLEVATAFCGSSTIAGQVDNNECMWWGGVRGISGFVVPCRVGATGQTLYIDAPAPFSGTLNYWVVVPN